MDKKLHSFVICAYKESPYLEACIQSLKKQSVRSNIMIATSTPNKWIERCGAKYQIPVIVNQGQGGIAQDWNFAYQQCDSDYVTIAHQDDIYFEQYTEKILKHMEDDDIIAFSNYEEIREGSLVSNNRNLLIKKIMLFPLGFPFFQTCPWIRRRVLSFGNPICCPAVTYAKKNLDENLFQVNFRSNVDWETWERLSRKKGRFRYVSQPLMGHRIHEGSETTATIQEKLRTIEDFEMFCKFWPKPIAKLLTRLYASSEESNEV